MNAINLINLSQSLYTSPMILLLSGSTDIARKVLIERLLKEKPSWRHIAMEELQELPFFKQAAPDEDGKLSASLAMTCAQEMQDEGFHILLTHANAKPFLESLHEEAEDQPFVSVYLGSEEGGEGYNHFIDTLNKSASDMYVAMKKIIHSLA